MQRVRERMQLLALIAVAVLAGCTDNPAEDVVDPFTETASEALALPESQPAIDTDGTTYTFQVLDYDTGEPLYDATVEVLRGDAPTVDYDGTFTIDASAGKFRVQAHNYDQMTFVGMLDGKNVVYKRAVSDRIWSTWSLYRRQDDSDKGKTYPLFEEALTFYSDGTFERLGDREAVSGRYFFTEHRSSTDQITGKVTSGTYAGFYVVNSEDELWYDIGSSVVRYKYSFSFWRPDGSDTLWFHTSSTGSVNDFLADPYTGGEYLLYSESGTDPDPGTTDPGGDGSLAGDVSFMGGTLSATAYHSPEVPGVWVITAGSYTVAIVNAPTGGTVELTSAYYTAASSTSPAVQVVDPSNPSVSYIAVSGSMTTTSTSLAVNATMKSLTDIILGGGTSYTLVIDIR